MPLIRDTINPTNEREVSPEEALDLERYGVLLDTSKTRAKTDEGLRAAAVRQVLEQRDGAAEADAPDVVDEPPATGPVDDTTDPGDDPASTTDDPDDSQES